MWPRAIFADDRTTINQAFSKEDWGNRETICKSRQSSTGRKARLGGISKRGDGYLRRLLVNSAHTVLLCSKAAKVDPWLTSLRGRKPRLVVAVALANKTARVAWAVMRRQDTYRRAAVAA